MWVDIQRGQNIYQNIGGMEFYILFTFICCASFVSAVFTSTNILTFNYCLCIFILALQARLRYFILFIIVENNRNYMFYYIIFSNTVQIINLSTSTDTFSNFLLE